MRASIPSYEPLSSYSRHRTLGAIYHARGNLDQAEGVIRKALEIDEKLGRLEGLGTEYGELGLVYRKRGALDAAEALVRKALEIDEEIGRTVGKAARYSSQADGDVQRYAFSEFRWAGTGTPPAE